VGNVTTGAAGDGKGVGEDDSGLLKVPVVAKMLGVAEVTVWRLIGRRELDSILVSARARRVSPEAVEDYKKRRENARTSPPSATAA
jgi:predicted DNA-binding transcriptional regulator AlpA